MAVCKFHKDTICSKRGRPPFCIGETRCGEPEAKLLELYSKESIKKMEENLASLTKKAKDAGITSEELSIIMDTNFILSVVKELDSPKLEVTQEEASLVLQRLHTDKLSELDLVRSVKSKILLAFPDLR